jgi:short-subunit dehydrogenase involved in D-alanine esterification of teichoic acids
MKTILITGTSSGVGATIAYDYIEKGWNVIGFARSESLFNYSNYKHYQSSPNMSFVNRAGSRNNFNFYSIYQYKLNK